jgi:multimeric flavodoxin WrbA
MENPTLVILKGSPRESGNSAILAERVAAGASESGASVESFYLHDMEIQPCDACDSCQGVADLDCIIEDDMQTLYPRLREADAVVYASPVYWFTVSAQMKTFMDRCYGLAGNTAELEEHALAGKRIGIVLTYAGDDPFDSGAVNAIRTFQDMFNYISAEIVGVVYGSAEGAGEIRSNREVMEKAYELGKNLISTTTGR